MDFHVQKTFLHQELRDRNPNIWDRPQNLENIGFSIGIRIMRSNVIFEGKMILIKK